MKKHGLRFLLLSFLLFTLIGCGGILTKSQIAEVKKFSNASNSYSEFPSTIINAHSKYTFNNELAKASSSTKGEKALAYITNGIMYQKEFKELENQTNKSCKVLSAYSSVLIQLTSDYYAANTQACLENFAGELDSSLAEYNKIRGTKYKPIGGSIAAALRLVSSNYIKRKQYKAIKEIVIKADPIVEELTTNIIELLSSYKGEEGIENLNKQKNYLKAWYKSFGYKEPLSTSIWFAKEIKAMEATLLLTDKSKIAAQKLRSAHKTLMENIQKPMDLKNAIKNIETLVDEVKAAKDLKEKLEN